MCWFYVGAVPIKTSNAVGTNIIVDSFMVVGSSSVTLRR